MAEGGPVPLTPPLLAPFCHAIHEQVIIIWFYGTIHFKFPASKFAIAVALNNATDGFAT